MQRIRGGVRSTATVWIMLGLAVGCGTKPAAPTGSGVAASADDPNRPLVIAVIPKGTQHLFWNSVHAGALKAQDELPNIKIEWKGPAKENDAEQQIQVVENFINRKVDAIVLAPADRKTLVGPVELAATKGIPVIVIDSGLDSDKRLSYVATDNYNGGVLAAREMAKVLNKQGKVIVLRYQPNSGSTEQRESGFVETLAKEFPQITVLTDKQYCPGGTPEAAQAVAESLLTRFAGEIDGWFCPCEPVTFGVVQAISRDAKAKGKIKVVGFDSNPGIATALKAGEIQALILQDPVNMGYQGVKTAVEHLRGQKVEAIISTGENVITPANADEPRSRELLTPDLSVWLKG